MDHIKNIIHTLSDDQQKRFVHFSKRYKPNHQSIELKLFKLLCESREYSTEEILQLLFSKNKKQAYYATRKRLQKSLSAFLVCNQLDSDESDISLIHHLISIAKHMYEHNQHESAYHFLLRAEKKGVEVNSYEQLNLIYNLLLEKIEFHGDIDFPELINKHHENRQKINLQESINLAHSHVKYMLIEAQQQGLQIDLDRMISKAFAQHGINPDEVENLPDICNLLSIIRKSLFAQKQFHLFVPFISEKYQFCVERSLFNDADSYYQLQILYMLAHAHYRVRNYKESQQYLDEMELLLPAPGKAHYHFFYPKFILLTAAHEMFIYCRPEKAMQVLKLGIQASEKFILKKDLYNMKINLAINYYLIEDYKAAWETLTNISNSENKCIKVMGMEWSYKRSMLEVITLFELDMPSVFDSRIRSMERRYKQFFEGTKFTNAQLYLKVVKEAAYDPDYLTSPDFVSRLNHLMAPSSRKKQDIQSLFFLAWIQSKVTKTTYTESLYPILNQAELATA